MTPEPLRKRCVFSKTLENLTLTVPPPATMAWRAVVRVLRSHNQPLHDLSTVLFPSPCRCCGATLLRISPAPVCDECLARMAPQTTLNCTRCGEALGAESDRMRKMECATCRLATPPFVRAVAYGLYQDEMRRALHLLKYERVVPMAKMLAEKLAVAMLSLADETPRKMTVIAVPLHPIKERERGFNQSILLADAAIGIVRRSGWELTAGHDLLKRVKNTESQFFLTPHLRRKNLSGAFAVTDKDALAGRDVLLVDDIYTTGATARACSKTLRRAGAKRVWVATLSRAQTETYVMWKAS